MAIQAITTIEAEVKLWEIYAAFARQRRHGHKELSALYVLLATVHHHSANSDLNCHHFPEQKSALGLARLGATPKIRRSRKCGTGLVP